MGQFQGLLNHLPCSPGGSTIALSVGLALGELPFGTSLLCVFIVVNSIFKAVFRLGDLFPSRSLFPTSISIQLLPRPPHVPNQEGPCYASNKPYSPFVPTSQLLRTSREESQKYGCKQNGHALQKRFSHLVPYEVKEA